ncbi:MAG TPA: FAD-dependent oxidoreductase [Candidatus Limnocylindrales bacterium]|nr:FAD-dependent oxidoreductase [Candidatus Limnocylindrales bacterium]
MGQGRRRIVIIGAGVVGAALADELTERGETDVAVLDRGPLFRTGGSSSHAPGLASRTSPSRLLQRLADHTLTKLAGLEVDGRPCLLPVGTVEVALDADRLRELRRREGAAFSWGWQGAVVDAAEIRRRWPILRADGLLGGFVTEGEGLVHALRAVEAQARRAEARGAQFRGDREVTGFEIRDGHVQGVRIADGGTVPADVVVLAAGVWGPRLASLVGLPLPTVAMEHQYAVTEPLPQLARNADREATLPILRHHDAGIYLRDHGDRLGIGSFAHAPLPVGDDRLTGPDLAFPFTPADFGAAWAAATHLIPALSGIALEHRFNGVFSFTPDGLPLLGEHPDLRGFWVAEAAWVTHSAGLARAVAELLTGSEPFTDVAPADLGRFPAVELADEVVAARCADAYRDVYVPHHPAEGHTSARGLRWSPFATAQRALGAEFVDVGGWERPAWYGANARLVDDVHVPRRDEWSSRHWSPIAVAEHVALRERGGLVDLTPLTRIEVTGPDAEALLLRVAAGQVDRAPGRITYTVLPDEHGGVRSDVTVARLASDRYLVGANGPRDVTWLRRIAAEVSPDGRVEVREVTDSTCCLAVWGPLARDLLAPLAGADLTSAAFPYLAVRETTVAAIPVIASRISYAGELGWELVAAADHGADLWAAVHAAAAPLGIVPVGRAALGTLRLEKGYRMTGAELTTEHGPDESGLAGTVRRDGPDFIGRDGLERRRAVPAARRLRTLALDGEQVVLGGEPVVRDDQVVGYVTSGGWGATVGRSIALAWLEAAIQPGDRVVVRYLGDPLTASVCDDRPLHDPDGSRLRA